MEWQQVESCSIMLCRAGSFGKPCWVMEASITELSGVASIAGQHRMARFAGCHRVVCGIGHGPDCRLGLGTLLMHDFVR